MFFQNCADIEIESGSINIQICWIKVRLLDERTYYSSFESMRRAAIFKRMVPSE